MIKKYTILSLIIFFSTISLFSQKISNIDYDKIKENIQFSASKNYYPKLLERFKQFDKTLTEEEFSLIYYGNVFYDKYSPYGYNPDINKFLELYYKEDYKEAIIYGKKVFETNPVNLKVLFKLLACSHRLEDLNQAKNYAYLYRGLINEVYKSGDGNNLATAYVVVNISDEYEILADLKLSSSSQVLVGETDILTIDGKNHDANNENNSIEKLYFNVYKPLEYLQKQFGK